jgi:hypothetical protein
MCCGGVVQLDATTSKKFMRKRAWRQRCLKYAVSGAEQHTAVHWTTALDTFHAMVVRVAVAVLNPLEV